MCSEKKRSYLRSSLASGYQSLDEISLLAGKFHCSTGAKSLKAHVLRRDKGLIYIAGLQVGIRLYMNSLIVGWKISCSASNC